ncbi:hypothetical protein B0I35DRAFT_473560 [Stachybotrys elegans]|uniref:Nucleolar protein 12 n=1 Tax=Stachybotrys elegans TaxID=80388 RepID=A0A8K0WWQ1_9HYPO|nr:hypothetical protein B0I35DRAFT_473560 [Stachybotrys elegans]
MAKSKKGASLSATSKAVDPTLDALFASSAGPVQAPPISRYSQLAQKKQQEDEDEEAEGSGDDEVLSEISEELNYSDDEYGSDGNDGEKSSSDEPNDAEGDEKVQQQAEAESDTAMAEAEAEQQPRRERKRKRKNDNDDLEEKYLAGLTKDDAPEHTGKRLKGDEAQTGKDADEEDSDNEVPVHESLTQESKSSDLEKAARTVFLSNVPSEAISSKSAKKTLMNHLSTIFDSEDKTTLQKIESIRFRSLAFSTGSMPKRAAYITKSLMEATTKSANAYVVYSTPVLARKAASELNGTEVLGRHIRVDSVAHPSPTDHRRCVFVGNLGFVDDETILNTTAEGEKVQKKRNKVPADVEEGLWRTFGKQGKVENVRVVRDPVTRVGKGFAYVQFYDANDVEAALLLDGKKFPPMLPRALRVTRAKDPRKTAMAQERAKAKAIAGIKSGQNTKYKRKFTSEEQSLAGRAGRLLGRAGAAQQRRELKGGPKTPGTTTAATDNAGSEIKTPEQIIFEGKRASIMDGQGKDFKKSGKKRVGKPGRPDHRGARRAAEWKKKKT